MGQLKLILRLLEQRFGELEQSLKKQIEELSSSDLELLSVAIFQLAALEDLSHWLADHSNRNQA